MTASEDVGWVFYSQLWVLDCRLKWAAFGSGTLARVARLWLRAADPPARILLSCAIRVGRDVLNLK